MTGEYHSIMYRISQEFDPGYQIRNFWNNHFGKIKFHSETGCAHVRARMYLYIFKRFIYFSRMSFRDRKQKQSLSKVLLYDYSGTVFSGTRVVLPQRDAATLIQLRRHRTCSLT